MCCVFTTKCSLSPVSISDIVAVGNAMQSISHQEASININEAEIVYGDDDIASSTTEQQRIVEVNEDALNIKHVAQNHSPDELANDIVNDSELISDGFYRQPPFSLERMYDSPNVEENEARTPSPVDNEENDPSFSPSTK